MRARRLVSRMQDTTSPLSTAALSFGEWEMKGAGAVESCSEPDFLTDIISVHPITTCEEQ